MSNVAIKTDSLTAREMVRAPSSITATTRVNTPILIASQGIATPSLTLGGEDVLAMTSASEAQTLSAVFVGGETGTYSTNVSSRILDIKSDMHTLDVTNTE